MAQNNKAAKQRVLYIPRAITIRDSQSTKATMDLFETNDSINTCVERLCRSNLLLNFGSLSMLRAVSMILSILGMSKPLNVVT
jgi:hypothetical protein